MWKGGAWDSMTRLAKVMLEKALIIDTPEGKCRVKNLYIDPETGKLVVEYEDTPEGG